MPRTSARCEPAIRDAIDNVLQDAIAFTPTLVVLTSAAVVGDRLYVRLLLADQDGERTFEALRDSPDFDPAAAELPHLAAASGG